MKVSGKYYIILAISLILFIIIEVYKPPKIDWRHSFSSRDKIPYGTAVLYNLMPSMFSNGVERINETAYEYLVDKDTAEIATFLYINNYFTWDAPSFKSLLGYAERGNEVFISSYSVDTKLLDTLGIDIRSHGISMEMDKKMLIDGVSIHLDTSAKNAFFKLQSNYFLWNKDSVVLEVIGKYGNGKSNFIKVPFGKGCFFLHSMPQVFSNYYLLKGISYEYVEKALGFLDKRPVIWDDYINNGAMKSTSSLRVLLENEPLRYAYYLFLFALFVFLLFGSKRYQRAIPILFPWKNASLDFVSTITNLYISQKDHKAICMHKIKGFYYMMHKKYNIPPHLKGEAFLKVLSVKTGRTLEETESLFRYFDEVKKLKKINKKHFIELSKKIELYTH